MEKEFPVGLTLFCVYNERGVKMFVIWCFFGALALIFEGKCYIITMLEILNS